MSVRFVVVLSVKNGGVDFGLFSDRVPIEDSDHILTVFCSDGVWRVRNWLAVQEVKREVVGNVEE